MGAGCNAYFQQQKSVSYISSQLVWSFKTNSSSSSLTFMGVPHTGTWLQLAHTLNLTRQHDFVSCYADSLTLCVRGNFDGSHSMLCSKHTMRIATHELQAQSCQPGAYTQQHSTT